MIHVTVSYEPFHESITGVDCEYCCDEVYPAMCCGDYEPRRIFRDAKPSFAVSGLKEEGITV